MVFGLNIGLIRSVRPLNEIIMLLTEFIQLVIDAYVNTPFVDLPLVLSGFLYIIPTGLSIYYYNKVGSFDYLIIGIMTLIMFVDLAFLPLRGLYGVVSPVMDDILLHLVYFTGVFAIPFALLHCVRYKWGNQSRLLMGVLCVFLFLFVRATLLIYFFEVLVPYDFLVGLSFELIRTSVGLFWMYVYLSTVQVIKYERIRIPRALWIFYGFYSVIVGCLGILREFSQEFDFTVIFPDIQEIIWNLGFFGSVFTLLVIASLFPEMFLLSEAQIHDARKLYDEAERINCNSEKLDKDKLLAHMCTYLKEAKKFVKDTS